MNLKYYFEKENRHQYTSDLFSKIRFHEISLALKLFIIFPTKLPSKR